MTKAGAGAGAPDPDIVAVNGDSAPPGLTAEQLAEAAANHRAEADAIRELSLQAADEREAQAKAALEAVAAEREKAEDDHVAALAYADKIEAGETI